MQTFLPFPSFAASEAVLDVRRLGKQRVEAVQVLRGLVVPGYGWRRHPAVRMWRGTRRHSSGTGWRSAGRGPRRGAPILVPSPWSRTSGRGSRGGGARTEEQLAGDGDLPPWLGAPDFHRSHQSALVRKHPDFYRECFPGIPDDLPYVWPRSDRETDGVP
ncbi:MSMEG_6728 family protein [Streptomyces virginiae]|uniref:MSMEG_6728 family protein n=1 Tax=Streptomyces virginiae TaxID=1961 RepID=UPI0035D87930